MVRGLIVGAGTGARFGGPLPKQYRKIAGEPVLSHTLRQFELCEAIDEVYIVAASDWVGYIERELAGHFQKTSKVVHGAATRQQSVFAGLRAMPNETLIVAIHDAVRPVIASDRIEAVVTAARDSKAAILAVPLRDTIKHGKGGFVVETVDRDTLWSVQTPQAFEYTTIVAAHEKAAAESYHATDDAALIEWIGGDVQIVPGDYQNIKITVEVDLAIAEVFLRELK